MITICKTFTFDAAHHIPTMPEGHKCRGMHGHTYSVDLLLRGNVPAEVGFFIDYGDIVLHWAGVHELIDHKVLNNVAGLEIPTTEVLAKWVFEKLVKPLHHYEEVQAPGALGRGFFIREHWLHAVRVHESSTTWCEYTPSA